MNSKNTIPAPSTSPAPAAMPAPTANDSLAAAPIVSPCILPESSPRADDPDPKLLVHFQASARSTPVPLAIRRVEIKARAGSFLRKLSEAQQEQLFLWLDAHSVPQVVGFIAQPPPVGFGLTVQETTLRRIRATMLALRPLENYRTSALVADSLSEMIAEDRADFAPVIGDLLLQKTFDLARNQTPVAHLKSIVSSFVKLREIDLKARRLQLESRRLEREASPQRHHVDLNVIPIHRPPQPAGPNPPELTSP